MKSMNKILYQFCKGTTSKTKNLYETLKIPPKSTQQQIKASYYKLAKQYHPDSNPKNTQLFKQINQAYRILKDPLQKTVYDQQNFTERGSPKTTTYYNTQHDYGNIYRRKQPDRPNAYGYGQNPYQSSTNHYGVEFNQFLKQEYQKNIRTAQKQSKRKKKIANNVMLIMFGIVGTLLIGQMMLKVYQFNSLQKKYSYPERLNPQQQKYNPRDFR